jgi:HPt (histidine-containing phosphotransfer) domain-containing protein
VMTPPLPIPVLDRVEGLRRAGGNKKLFLELVEVLRADLPRLTQLINTAIDQQSAPAVREAAHALRGSVSQLGALAVAERAGILEKIGIDGDLRDAERHQHLLAEDLRQLTLALFSALHAG